MSQEKGACLAHPHNESCPVERTALLIGSKWTLLIIRDLVEGHRRFGELQKSLTGISPRTLSQRLGKLTEEGLVTRRIYAEVPPRVEYSLTDKGHALLPLIEAMKTYGSRWL